MILLFFQQDFIAGPVWPKPYCIAIHHFDHGGCLFNGFFCNSLFCFKKNRDLMYHIYIYGLLVIPGMERKC